MTQIHLRDLEAAIAWARQNDPGDAAGIAELSSHAAVLSESAPWMQATEISASAKLIWLDWYDTTPDTPCIAICSTSQGDDLCKGCGRTFDEVIGWLGFTPFQKRETWQRISEEATAWRFTTYKERARN